MSVLNNHADKASKEAYRAGRKAVFDVFIGNRFTIADIAEQVDLFNRDTKSIGSWINMAVSVGEVEVHREAKQFSFYDTVAKLLARDRPTDGVVGDPRLNQLPPIPPVEVPNVSPVTKKVQDLVQFDEVHRFFVTVIVSIGGVAWLLRERIESEVKKYRGWDTGKPTGARSIIARLLEEGYIENDGSSRYFVYRITTQAAVKFLDWDEEQAVALGFTPPVKKTNPAKVVMSSVVKEIVDASPKQPQSTTIRQPRLVQPPDTYPGKDGVVLGELIWDKSVQRWLLEVVREIGGFGWVKMTDIVREVRRYEGWQSVDPSKGVSRFCGRFIRDLNYLDERAKNGYNKPREVKITKRAAHEVFGWSEKEWYCAIGAYDM